MKHTNNSQVQDWRYNMNENERMIATLEEVLDLKGKKMARLEVKNNGQKFNILLPLERVSKLTLLLKNQKFFVSPEDEKYKDNTYIVYQLNTDRTKRYFYGIANRYGSS